MNTINASRIVCWFSCGAASAVATKLTIAQYPGREIVIARLGSRMTRDGDTRIFLDELRPGTGDYQTEPEIQCGLFCEMAKGEYA